MPTTQITILNVTHSFCSKQAQKCYCEAENCRGWIGSPPNSDDEEADEDEDDDKGDDDGNGKFLFTTGLAIHIIKTK